MKVLILGKKGIVVDDIQNHLQMQNVELFGGTGIEDVRSVFSEQKIDHVIMGAGIELDKRLQIIKEIYERSESTTVHMKDFASGPNGMLPFVRAVITGLQK
ncbi:MAG: hypothetical protein KGM99_15485 [Burkholderiales bacterium]|nr:hypothetical protein [Burkholderiales bacterium]